MVWKERGFSLYLLLSFAEEASLDTLDTVFSLLFSSSVSILVTAESEGITLALKLFSIDFW